MYSGPKRSDHDQSETDQETMSVDMESFATASCEQIDQNNLAEDHTMELATATTDRASSEETALVNDTPTPPETPPLTPDSHESARCYPDLAQPHIPEERVDTQSETDDEEDYFKSKRFKKDKRESIKNILARIADIPDPNIQHATEREDQNTQLHLPQHEETNVACDTSGEKAGQSCVAIIISPAEEKKSEDNSRNNEGKEIHGKTPATESIPQEKKICPPHVAASMPNCSSGHEHSNPMVTNEPRQRVSSAVAVNIRSPMSSADIRGRRHSIAAPTQWHPQSTPLPGAPSNGKSSTSTSGGSGPDENNNGDLAQPVPPRSTNTLNMSLPEGSSSTSTSRGTGAYTNTNGPLARRTPPRSSDIFDMVLPHGNALTSTSRVPDAYGNTNGSLCGHMPSCSSDIIGMFLPEGSSSIPTLGRTGADGYTNRPLAPPIPPRTPGSLNMFLSQGSSSTSTSRGAGAHGYTNRPLAPPIPPRSPGIFNMFLPQGSSSTSTSRGAAAHGYTNRPLARPTLPRTPGSFNMLLPQGSSSTSTSGGAGAYGNTNRPLARPNMTTWNYRYRECTNQSDDKAEDVEMTCDEMEDVTEDPLVRDWSVQLYELELCNLFQHLNINSDDGEEDAMTM